MKPKFKYLLSVIIVGVIITGSFLALSVYEKLKEPAMKACIFSLESSIVDLAGNSGSESSISLSAEWRTLSREESRTLIHRLIMSGATDCGTIKNMQEGEDYWGNPVKIMLRKSSAGGEIEATIWSTGADGKDGTEDDIRFEKRHKSL